MQFVYHKRLVLWSDCYSYDSICGLGLSAKFFKFSFSAGPSELLESTLAFKRSYKLVQSVYFAEKLCSSIYRTSTTSSNHYVCCS